MVGWSFKVASLRVGSVWSASEQSAARVDMGLGGAFYSARGHVSRFPFPQSLVVVAAADSAKVAGLRSDLELRPAQAGALMRRCLRGVFRYDYNWRCV